MTAIAALHAGFLWSTRGDPVFRVPYLDGAFYHTWARSLAEGRGDFQGPYFLGPLYPWFVSLLYRLHAPDPMAVRLAQTGLGILDVALVLGLGKKLFGNAAGIAAALLFGMYGPLVFHEGLLVMESLVLTLVLASLYVLLVPRWGATWRGAIAGLLLGLASLGRPTVLVAAPVALAALWPAGMVRGAARNWLAVAACAAACFAVMLPVLVRNARLGAGPVLTTNGGVNFYAGNSAGANGRFREPPGVRFFTTPALDPAHPEAPLPTAVASRALTVRAVAGTDAAANSAEWRRRAWQWIVAHPGEFLQLTLRRFWLVLQAREVPQIESYDFQRQRLAPLRAFWVDFTWIWPLAALGLWHALRDRLRDARVVAGFALAMLFPCLTFFVTSRYRLAAVPELALLAGCGVSTLATWAARRQTRSLGLALCVLAPIAVLTRLGGSPPAGAAGWENAQMAERLYALGDLDGAIRYQEEAARRLPNRLEAQVNLALYWSERNAPGDAPRAEALLREAARRAPGQAVVLFNLGTVLVQEGRVGEARAAWREALRLDPSFEPARARLLQSSPADSTSHP